MKGVQATLLTACLLLTIVTCAVQHGTFVTVTAKVTKSNPPLDPEQWIKRRQAHFGEASGRSARWLFPADAFARHQQYADAAGLLLGAVEANPADAEAWTALGDALVGHAGGWVTPAAAYAYHRAGLPDWRSNTPPIAAPKPCC